ncbi:MAG: DUF4115 domain-containing protein [Candidatus Marinimicrobia bacterium]|nr:DUF4115 domain-containing protein [Candidatus Neomarinimicrobiota bacterium]
MFYKELQEKRKALGLTLEQVSQKIKISIDNLKNIEKGDFTQLPDLYIRLFVKTYAQELGFDPLEYLKKYEDFSGSKKHDVMQNYPEKTDEKTPLNINSSFSQMSDRSKLITFMVILILLVFVIIILKQVLSENDAKTVNSLQQQLTEMDSLQTTFNSIDAEMAQEEDLDTQQKPMSEGKPVNSEPENNASTVADSNTQLKLNIEINDTCWVKIVLDQKDTSEALFRPGATREWTAFEVFDLRVGRPEVVSLYLNGTKLDSVDYGVAPARLVITKDGIINR